MARYKAEDIRNVALVGHGASGKTTLADLMLFKGGHGSRAGSVDDGTSVLDTDEEEKERKLTITSKIAHFDRKGKRVNVLDTPGYPDFIGQVCGALRAVETAVIVVNAAAGIEVNTRKVFQLASDAGVGRVILVNKCDMDNVRVPELLDSLKEVFGQACVPLNVPVGISSSFSGVVSTLNVPDSVPSDVVLDPNEIHQKLMDAIVEADDELMERFLEGEELSQEEIAGGISKAIASGTLIPIFFASSKADIGVDELMDALADYAPSPLDVKRTALKGEEEVELAPDPDQPLVAQVFKTRIDPFVAKMSYIRVFSGTLKKDTPVVDLRTGQTLRFSQLLEIQGAEQSPVDEAGPGEIVAVVKMEALKTGDTLCSDADGPRMPDITFPRPMVSLAVQPKSQADQAKISDALQKVQEEDPTIKISRDPQTKELVVSGMSELHLQIILERLKRRDKVETVTKIPKVPYRETCTATATGSYRHKKQTGGAGQFAEVHFKISPCPRGINPEEYFTKDRFENMRAYHYDPELNFCFVDRIVGGVVPNQFIPAVEKGVRERMAQGVLAGYQVQDVICELYFGKDHPVDSNETAFRTAASMCFREVFMQAKPVLLEPIVSMEIVVPADKLGDVSSDLSTRRGRMEGMESAPGGYQIIKAKMPLAEVLTYSRALSSMTGGQGTFTYEFSHYEVVPPNEQAKIIAAAEKEKEEG